MNDTIEKSCWGITLWTVAAVIAAGLLFSGLSGSDRAKADTATVISQ
ncbi:MAG: hypothetical protein AAGF28_13145 [Pseudomonadota bacterium]